MDDGSCNHISCLICGSEFCWLCMKEISDLHYLRLVLSTCIFIFQCTTNADAQSPFEFLCCFSPSGCTFWGKKPWSRKKKILWQLGTLVGAPIGIGLVAGIAIPAMIIGIPVWVGIKVRIAHSISLQLSSSPCVHDSESAVFRLMIFRRARHLHYTPTPAETPGGVLKLAYLLPYCSMALC